MRPGAGTDRDGLAVQLGKLMVAPAQTPPTIGVSLVLMSVASGCMDVMSYRLLGQVFTSAMTGNAALLGLDFGQGNLAGMSRNMLAFLGFLAGLVLGALLLCRRAGASRGVTGALLVEEALLLGFAALWHVGAGPSSDRLLYGLIALSAVAMGVQSTVAHRIGVPGITTTYFTGTLTSIVMGLAGGGAAPRPRGRLRWPVLSFLAYILGAALTGALLLGRVCKLRTS